MKDHKLWMVSFSFEDSKESRHLIPFNTRKEARDVKKNLRDAFKTNKNALIWIEKHVVIKNHLFITKTS